jgi:protein-disulfide isomerase
MLCFALLLGALIFGPDAYADGPRDIPAGFTADGAPYLGSKDAPVTLEEWSDYQCPFCRRHYQETAPTLLEQYVRPGKVRLVFRDFPLETLHPTSMAGHIAARCVGRQGAERYWAMHDALFERQAEWNQLPDPGPFLAELAAGVGADKAAVISCIADGEAREAVAKSVAEANGRSYSSTPTFRFHWAEPQRTHDIMGAHPLERFNEILGAVLAGKDPPAEAAPKPAELPLGDTTGQARPVPPRLHTHGRCLQGCG